MYFDLFLPFPLPASADAPTKKSKGKGKAPAPAVSAAGTPNPETCWDGIDAEGREEFARVFGLAGHLGYNVVAPTVIRETESTPWPSPFHTLPYPHLDPRHASSSSASSAGPSTAAMKGKSVVQVTRYHFKLDDAKTHPLSSNNTNALQKYDILSCQPTNEKALQLACLDFSNPGPSQISIITLPLHERPYHFRLNRKQINQAQRNGVVNWMTNAREIVRITGGKGVIFSSGPGGSAEGMRSPADLINLSVHDSPPLARGTRVLNGGALYQADRFLGMPANVAKDAVSLGPKMVLLKAQARRTFKAVLSAPQLVPSISAAAAGDGGDVDMHSGDDSSDNDILDNAGKRRKGKSAGGRKKKRASASAAAANAARAVRQELVPTA